MSDHLGAAIAGSNRKDGAIGVGTVLRGLRRHPFLTLFSLVAVVAVGAAVWVWLPLPKATAYATFQISSQPQNLLTPVGDDKADFRLYCQAQAVLVKSRPVLSAALASLTAQDPNFRVADSRGDEVSWLNKNLQVDFQFYPEFMRLSIEGDDPENMTAVVKSIRSAYMSTVVEREKNKRSAFIDQLQELKKQYEQTLLLRQRAVNSLVEFLGSEVPENLAVKEKFVHEQLGMAERELLQLQSEMRRALVEGRKLDAKVADVEKRPVPDDALREAIKGDPEYQKLLAYRNAVREWIENTKGALAPGARPPVLVQQEERLVEANKELDAYMQRVRPDYTAQLKKLMTGESQQSQLQLTERKALHEDLEKTIKNDIDNLEKKLKASNRNQAALENLKSQMAQTKKMAERVSLEIEQMRPEVEAPPRVSVWEEPNVSPGVEGNRRLKYSLLAGAVVLLLGVGLVTVVEARNRYVITSDDAADIVGLRLIGTIPLLPRNAMRADRSGARIPSVWQAMLTESVDAIRTMLIHSADAPRPRLTALIASAMPAEGKTMLAANLASSLARAGFRTLLIDGDLRRPTLQRSLAAPLTPGLCELLRGETSPAEAVRETGFPGLSFLPAGQWNPAVTQALAGNRWKEIKARLETQFDYIIIDSSPLLLVTDALLLARHVDGAVLSVFRNVSDIDAVGEARDRLQGLGVKILGVVLNGLGNHRYHSAYYPYLRAGDGATPAALIEARPEQLPAAGNS